VANDEMELLRVTLLVFFATHVPATLLIDSQAVLPARYVPPLARQLLEWHVANTGDPLMAPLVASRSPAPWFRALVLGELSLQLPFFFVAVYAFARRRNWIRLPALVYGVHTATTLLPILAELAAATSVTEAQRLTLLAVYLPYFMLPLACAVWMCSCEEPFARRHPKAKAS